MFFDWLWKSNLTAQPVFNQKISVGLAWISRLLINASSDCRFPVLALQFEYTLVILVRVFVHYFSFCLFWQIKHSWEHSQKLKSAGLEWPTSRLILQTPKVGTWGIQPMGKDKLFDCFISQSLTELPGTLPAGMNQLISIMVSTHYVQNKVFASLGWERFCWS